MKFGKLSDISQVDFKLPIDPESTKVVLGNLSKAEKPILYVGCTGWSMKEWVGTVYPATAKVKDYLTHYAKQFNTIELNTTHYRIPNIQTIDNWRQQSAADFRFCPKILQAISHSRELGFGTGRTLAFCESIQGLEEKLGCCFMQLPPYFGIDRLGLLERFVESFPSTFASAPIQSVASPAIPVTSALQNVPVGF